MIRSILLLAFACCGLPAARAVIVYTDIADVGLFSVGEPLTYPTTTAGITHGCASTRRSIGINGGYFKDFALETEAGSRWFRFQNPQPPRYCWACSRSAA